MPEPTAPPAVESLTPDQAATEFSTLREHPDLYDPTRPAHVAVTQRMNALTERLQTGAEPASASSAPPPDESAPRPTVVDDPYHTDPTAAVLDAVPLPAGLDPEKSRAVNALAEREGMTRFVLEGRHVIAGALSGPSVDAVAAERQLQQRWGSMFPSKLEAAHLAFDALPAEVRAELEGRELDVHPAVLDYLARVGEALMDPSTPGGERRLKAKYQQWVASQTR